MGSREREKFAGHAICEDVKIAVKVLLQLIFSNTRKLKCFIFLDLLYIIICNY
jgi:hypothetical protein